MSWRKRWGERLHPDFCDDAPYPGGYGDYWPERAAIAERALDDLFAELELHQPDPDIQGSGTMSLTIKDSDGVQTWKANFKDAMGQPDTTGTVTIACTGNAVDNGDGTCSLDPSKGLGDSTMTATITDADGATFSIPTVTVTVTSGDAATGSLDLTTVPASAAAAPPATTSSSAGTAPADTTAAAAPSDTGVAPSDPGVASAPAPSSAAPGPVGGAPSS